MNSCDNINACQHAGDQNNNNCPSTRPLSQLSKLLVSIVIMKMSLHILDWKFRVNRMRKRFKRKVGIFNIGQLTQSFTC